MTRTYVDDQLPCPDCGRKDGIVVPPDKSRIICIICGWTHEGGE